MAVEVTKYQAEDGTFFDTMELAEQYEKTRGMVKQLRDFLYEETTLGYCDSEGIAVTLLEAFTVTPK